MAKLVGVVLWPACVALLFATHAQAASTDDTLKKTGLWGGPFATDCSQPAGPHNWQATFANDGPRVTMTYSGGAEVPPRVYVIKEAHALPDGSVAIDAEAQSNYAIHKIVYALGRDPDGFRPMSIRVVSGGAETVVVDKGAFVKTGGDTPRYVRCRK